MRGRLDVSSDVSSLPGPLGGRRLEKGVAQVGSMKVYFSEIEKGFEVSTSGAGILSRISNMIS